MKPDDIVAYKVTFESAPLYAKVRPEDRVTGEESEMREAAVDRIATFVQMWVSQNIKPVTQADIDAGEGAT